MSLADLQRTMASAVMQPLTAGENMRAKSRDGRPMRKVAASFIAPNSNLTPFERLEIYNRQYWYRVLSALAEDFPGLRAVVGSRKFHALSVAYLDAHPNRSFTLRNLGSHLAQWLAANPKYAGRRHALAVDVARIEWAFVETFDSAEDTPLTAEQIATLDAGSKLALQPHLQLIPLSYPADELVLNLHQRDKKQTSEAGVASEEDEEPPIALPHLRKKPTWLASHRVDFSVYYLRISREEFSTLAAIRQGIGLADALATGFVGSRIPAERRAAQVQQWFANWAELGWICTPPLESIIKD
ncbi:MAG: putative DNA-binding domain-containing protein [Acidobacteriota bacterium]|nr:putative DNA-binding domain-containing protein [Acidobacteriota bacterium]